MNCPKCNGQMMQVGFAELKDKQLFIEWQCMSCGYRLQMPVKKERLSSFPVKQSSSQKRALKF